MEKRLGGSYGYNKTIYRRNNKSNTWKPLNFILLMKGVDSYARFIITILAL